MKDCHDTATEENLRLARPSIGRPFEDKLLLAIIDAYPDADAAVAPSHWARSRERRLAAAKKALFGQSFRQRDPKLTMIRARSSIWRMSIIEIWQ